MQEMNKPTCFQSGMATIRLMIMLLILSYPISLSTSYSFSGWISPLHPVLPRPVYAMAICHLNNSIVLLGGGHENDLQMITYDIINNSIQDYGKTVLSLNMSAFGHGDYYTQIRHNFYWIEPITSHIVEYNILNDNFTSSIKMDIFVSFGSCLTSHENMLYILGGLNQMQQQIKTVQIFNLSSQTWVNSTQIPSMILARSHHSCIIDPVHNTLYAIGGLNDAVGALGSVEIISIDNIQHQSWNWGSTLKYSTMSSRTVIYQNMILVIGGVYYDLNLYQMLSEIQVIDCSTGIVSIMGYLDHAVATTSVVIVNDIVYAFGGSSTVVPPTGVNTWQYLKIASSDNTRNSIVYVGIAGGCVLLFCVISVIGSVWRRKRRLRFRENTGEMDELSEMLQK
eukprot:194910_1